MEPEPTHQRRLFEGGETLIIRSLPAAIARRDASRQEVDRLMADLRPVLGFDRMNQFDMAVTALVVDSEVLQFTHLLAAIATHWGTTIGGIVVRADIGRDTAGGAL